VDSSEGRERKSATVEAACQAGRESTWAAAAALEERRLAGESAAEPAAERRREALSSERA